MADQEPVSVPYFLFHKPTYQNKNFNVGVANWAILGVFISFCILGIFCDVSVPDKSLHDRKIITKRPATIDRCDRSAILNFYGVPFFFYHIGISGSVGHTTPRLWIRFGKVNHRTLTLHPWN